MRNTEAALYARWSGIFAMLLAIVVIGVYSFHAWQNHLSTRTAPAAVPGSIQQQSSAFSFSKQAGDKTEFTIRAAHATQFAEHGRDVLDDVWITVYGLTGQRFDNIHTRSCDFVESTGNILCGGDVAIDLQTAADAALHPATPEKPNLKAQIVHVKTSRMSFDRKSGLVSSDQRVTFQFSQGQGQATGFRYQTNRGELQLLHGVELALDQQDPQSTQNPNSDLPSKTVHVLSDSMIFQRDQLMVHFFGPVKAWQGTAELTAGKLDVQLNHDFRVRRLLAGDRPQMQLVDAPRSTTITAAEFSAPVAIGGWFEQVVADGNVHARTIDSGTGSDDRLEAGHARIELTPRTNQPRLLTAIENVVTETKDVRNATQRLATSKLELTFVPVPASTGASRLGAAASQTPKASGAQLDSGPKAVRGVQLARAVTPAAVIDTRGRSQNSDELQQLHLTGQHMEVLFGNANTLRQVNGTGGVKMERQAGTRSLQVSTSRDAVAYFGDDSLWSTVDQSGDVRLRENDRNAQGDRAHFDRKADTATLAGSVVLADSETRTTAQSAVLKHATNELTAEGRVATSDIPSSSGHITDLGTGPAHVSGDRLLSNTLTGHATYSGGARLWQGNSLVQADTIDLDRTAQVVVATNHVKAVFEQARWAPQQGNRTESLAAAAAKGPARNQFWRAEASKMTYASKENHARLEQNVHARSDDGAIHSDSMELFFAHARADSGSAAAKTPASSSSLWPSPNSPAVRSSLAADTHAEAVPSATVAAAHSAQDAARGVPQGGSSGKQAGSDQQNATEQNSGQKSGGQQLIRAIALGNVIVDQPDRHGTGSRGDYKASDGTVVLTGGPPRVYDNSGNSTSGRQLTLFLADDTIVIDSAEGVRTLSMHRVGK